MYRVVTLRGGGVNKLIYICTRTNLRSSTLLPFSASLTGEASTPDGDRTIRSASFILSALSCVRYGGKKGKDEMLSSRTGHT